MNIDEVRSTTFKIRNYEELLPLINLLVNEFNLNPKKYVSKEEISSRLPNIYTRVLEECDSINSSAYRKLRQDIEDIKFSKFEKIIVSNYHGYKIATYDEASQYLKVQLRNARKKIKIVNDQIRKAKKDKQFAYDEFLQEIKSTEVFNNGE
jgi:hypothetical protein